MPRDVIGQGALRGAYFVGFDLRQPGGLLRTIGLQAQENLPPYLSLAARLERFDPYDVSRGLEDRSLVRLLTMRGTIHLLVPDDALTLRGFTQPAHDRERRASPNTRPGIHLQPGEVRAALQRGLKALAGGQMALIDVRLAKAAETNERPDRAN